MTNEITLNAECAEAIKKEEEHSPMTDLSTMLVGPSFPLAKQCDGNVVSKRIWEIYMGSRMAGTTSRKK